jgi:hypothetical protein
MPGIMSNHLNLQGKSATPKENWGFPAQIFFVSTALVLLRHPRALHTVIPAKVLDDIHSKNAQGAKGPPLQRKLKGN